MEQQRPYNLFHNGVKSNGSDDFTQESDRSHADNALLQLTLTTYQRLTKEWTHFDHKTTLSPVPRIYTDQ